MIFSENRYPLFGIMLKESLCGRVALAADPGADFALGLRSGKAVAFLQPGGELVAAAVDAGDVFVGELGPVVPQLVFEVQPIALNLVPGHCCLHAIGGSAALAAAPRGWARCQRRDAA